MKKSFILTSALVAVFVLFTNNAYASTTTPKPSTVTVDASPSGFTAGGTGDITVNLTTINYPISSWSSTKLILEGSNDVCVNHGNHPLVGSQTYQEVLELPAPDSVGQYDLLIQAYTSDDCQSAIDKQLLKVVSVGEKAPPKRTCLNCKKSTLEKHASTTETSVSTNTSSTKKIDAEARKARKQKVDAFIKMYETKPGSEDILMLIKLLIAFDIIQV